MHSSVARCCIVPFFLTKFFYLVLQYSFALLQVFTRTIRDFTSHHRDVLTIDERQHFEAAFFKYRSVIKTLERRLAGVLRTALRICPNAMSHLRSVVYSLVYVFNLHLKPLFLMYSIFCAAVSCHANDLNEYR